MNTSFHYDGLELFKRTKAYQEQREAYRKDLIAKFLARNKGRDGRIYHVRKLLFINYNMSLYRMRLMF